LDKARETVRRTLLWAERSLKEFSKLSKNPAKPSLRDKSKPLLVGVVQGGFFPELRKECTKELIKMGYIALGYGGWPMTADNQFDYESAEIIAQNAKSDTLLYGLGIGKPHEIKALVKMGYTVFDCVLPTRDARHKRLYVYKAESVDEINLEDEKFYSYYTPDREIYYKDTSPVSTACDCLLCTHYSKAYLGHLFRINEIAAMRLASIHNLRFYSLLMEKLGTQEVLLRG
jgi:queuine tRNA-ribosyltransferase